MTFAEYRALPALNFSTLKHLARSPRAYQDALAHPTADTSAMQLGRAGHCAVLEPDEFPRRYMLFPSEFLARADLNRASTDGKKFEAAWLAADASRRKIKDADGYRRAVFCSEYPGVEVLDVAAYEQALAIRDAVRAHKPAMDLLDEGKAEQVIQWTDERTGIACKGRCDWITARALADLKTTSRLAPGMWSTEVARRHYHAQLAWYLDGAFAAGLGALVPVLLAVENSRPFDVGVFDLDEDAIYCGRETYRAWIDRLVICKRTGDWPGMYPQRETLSLPAWAFGPSEGDDFEVVTDGEKEAQ